MTEPGTVRPRLLAGGSAPHDGTGDGPSQATSGRIRAGLTTCQFGTWSSDWRALYPHALPDCVKVQVMRMFRQKGRDYYRTYVNVPSYVRGEMRLAAGDAVFLALAGGFAVRMSRERTHVDDFQVKLDESVTRRYRGEVYTTLRLTIPKALAAMMDLRKGDGAEFSYTGKSCSIDFRKSS